ncbi:hypothetical protein SKA15_15240 [Enterococcus faecium]|jgi:hypothetical protein
MKASELMIKLGSFIEKYGDLDICMHDGKSVEYLSHEDKQDKFIIDYK